MKTYMAIFTALVTENGNSGKFCQHWSGTLTGGGPAHDIPYPCPIRLHAQRPLRARFRPGVHDRHTGAGAGAVRPGAAGPRSRAQDRWLRFGLPRLTAWRPRHGIVAAKGAAGGRRNRVPAGGQRGSGGNGSTRLAAGGNQSDPRRRGRVRPLVRQGPGVDRAGDALKHGNAYGSSPHGGVLVVAGDDHGCVSSSMPHQSDVAFMAWFMPTLNPSSVAEYLEYAEYG